jgi:hypothetical protein
MTKLHRSVVGESKRYGLRIISIENYGSDFSPTKLFGSQNLVIASDDSKCAIVILLDDYGLDLSKLSV